MRHLIHLLHLTDRVKHNTGRMIPKMTTQRISISKTTSAGTDSSRSNTRSMQDNGLEWDQYDEYF